ncbi:MAG: cytochrome b/b6 domain-containing protein [Coriobacteriia bacterium]|nr:cytochrome b/b6 domain-containing protein [Coriobacteriia bacterium]
MARYIKRHSLQARITHDVFAVSGILLFLTGLFVFIPPLADAAPATTVYVIRIAHRVIGFIFILVPIISAILAPGGFKHYLSNYFRRWNKEDITWMKKFIPYMLAPKKVHMPNQPELKSGQVVADGALMLGAIVMAISGLFLVFGTWFVDLSAGLMVFMRLLHNIGFIWMIVFVIPHIYLGAGIFQPYRKTARLMFGDGKVSESDALYHWGNWAAEEFEKGEKVVEEDD